MGSAITLAVAVRWGVLTPAIVFRDAMQCSQETKYLETCSTNPGDLLSRSQWNHKNTASLPDKILEV